MTTYFYYVNICKHKYEKNMTRIWFKILFKTNVKQTKWNEEFYFYLYLFENLVLKKLYEKLYVCIE
jgi:hypothetical protein